VDSPTDPWKPIDLVIASKTMCLYGSLELELELDSEQSYQLQGDKEGNVLAILGK